jgi:uncharacterized membrane protein
MGLVLCNNYPTTIWTSIMFYSPETCGGDGGDFEKMGWWPIAPGACALVYANDLEDVNRFWYYYAEADDGAVWAGPFRTWVSLAPFGGGQWCWGLGTTAPGQVVIAYRELDIGDNDDYTLTFVP